MTQKEIYIDGRAEYLCDFQGYSLTEGVEIAKKEWEEEHIEDSLDLI